MEAVIYNGKEHGHLEKLQRVVKGTWGSCPGCMHRQQLGLTLSTPPSGLPDLQRVVLIPYVLPREKIDISKIPNR